jgi:hypothetical protein
MELNKFINPAVSQLVLYKQEVQEALTQSKVLLTEQEQTIESFKTTVLELQNALHETQGALEDVERGYKTAGEIERKRYEANISFLFKLNRLYLGIAAFEFIILLWRIFHV